ncbi:MAG: 4Fe-4S binding protein, partial [Deltaproteobacteria bacterium]
RLLKFYSDPAHIGPHISDELAALVRHLFSEEEAEVAQHLKIISGKTADYIAKCIHRPVEEVEAILLRLADEKRAVLAFSPEDKPKTYRLLPLMPGTFEMVLWGGKDDEWRRKFGELYNTVFNTGYIKRHLKVPVPVVRYIPVEESISTSPVAIPSDLLSEMIRGSDSFAVGVCVCRLALNFEGHEADLPRDTCLAIGKLADFMFERDIMRRVDRSEALEIKQRASKAGLATLSLNVDFTNPNYSCSCCSCCCVALRSISQFNTPGLIAPPHFIPSRNEGVCKQCRTCIEHCPMGVYELTDTGWIYRRERCIGCGVCASVCPQKAIQMEPVKDYHPPPTNYLNFGLNLGRNIFPGYLKYLFKRGK